MYTIVVKFRPGSSPLSGDYYGIVNPPVAGEIMATSGPTPQHVIGDLIMSHPGKLGIKVVEGTVGSDELTERK